MKNTNKKKTLDEFVKEFREKFPERDYYDFSETKYIDSKTKITVFCKKHNKYFTARAGNLLKGVLSCPDCKKELAEENNRLTKNRGKQSFQKFLEKNFKGILEYDINEYNGSHSEMTFTYISNGVVKKKTPSRLRSEFKIKSGQRKRSDASPEFYKNKLLKEGENLIKFINENYPFIDTSLVVYTGYRKKITLICNIHNIKFDIAPYTIKLRFDRGQELCDVCIREAQTNNRTEWYINEYNKIHPNNNFDFSNTKFLGFRENITVKCKLHNIVFSVRPMEFLKENTIGCPQCRLEHISKVSAEREGEKLKEYLDEYYPDIDTSLMNYVNIHTPIKLRCKKHNNIFEITPFKLKWVVPNQSTQEICPICKDENKSKRSKLEKKISMSIRDVLGIDEPLSEVEMSAEELNIYEPSIKNIRIDFIVNYNNIEYWIEGNGPQHYRPVYYFHRSKEIYERQLLRDSLVKNFVTESDDKVFIEIPYTYSTVEEISNLIREIILLGKDPLNIIKLPKIIPITEYKEEFNKYRKED